MSKKTENPHLSIYEQMRDVPDNARDKIKGGRLQGKTSINTMWRIKRLTEIFGPCGIGWNYRVTGTRTEEIPGRSKALFVDIAFKFKVPGTETWSEEIPGTGGNTIICNETKGPYLNDDAYKMAVSDAISNACKLLGLGADVYFENDVENKYMHDSNQADNISVQPSVPESPTSENIPRPNRQAAFANGRKKPEMNKLNPQWNYSISFIAASKDSPEALRRQMETMFTVTDETFNELLRLAGRQPS